MHPLSLEEGGHNLSYEMAWPHVQSKAGWNGFIRITNPACSAFSANTRVAFCVAHPQPHLCSDNRISKFTSGLHSSVNHTRNGLLQTAWSLIRSHITQIPHMLLTLVDKEHMCTSTTYHKYNQTARTTSTQLLQQPYSNIKHSLEWARHSLHDQSNWSWEPVVQKVSLSLLQ